LRELNRRHPREVPDDAPLPFASKAWKRLVREGGRINRRLYEVAVLATLRDRLRGRRLGERHPQLPALRHLPAAQG